MRRNMMLLFALFTVLLFTASASAQAVIELQTDKGTYLRGEPVEIVLVNTGTETGFVCDFYQFWVYRGDTPVFNPLAMGRPCIAEELAPGAVKYVGTWDQTYYRSPLGPDGNQVRPGAYRVDVGSMDLSAGITIIGRPFN